ncbi:MAG: 50S ribosomal protein L21 [bacterium]|nr:50S ribosomal protein L21 [bacterium]
MFAVFTTGGKQYLVEPGAKLKIEKIEAKKNGDVVFDKVLLVEKNRKLEIGTPYVKGAKVTGKVLSEGKADKVIVYKRKAKKRYARKRGHRQPFTEVEISGIETSAA